MNRLTNKNKVMEIKNIHNHAGWFASYMNAPDGGNDEQGQALVECQIKKIEQLINLIDTIKGEIELAEDPKEYSVETILNSIKALVNNIPEVEQIRGHYKWIG